MGKRKDLTYWNIPVPKPLDNAVEEAIKRDMHVSKSDFVRDAVRRLLEQMSIPLEERLGGERTPPVMDKTSSPPLEEMPR